MSRLAPTTLLAILGTAALVVATLAGGFAGLNRAAAQGGTPVATPVGEPSCTADLGIVRSTKTCVSVVHASPNVPQVDILVNGQVAIEGLRFGTASGFASIPAGTFDVQIVPSDEGPDAAIVDIIDVELVAGRAYEIAVVNSPAETWLKLSEVDVYAVEGTSQAGSTRIRLINAATDVPSVDLDLIGGDIATRQFSDLAFPETSDYSVIAAGTYRVRLTESASGRELVVLPEFTFDRDTETSLYVIGASGDDTLTILPVTTQASRLPAPAQATPAASPAV